MWTSRKFPTIGNIVTVSLLAGSLSACAIKPLPRDVGYLRKNTLKIALEIRCETRLAMESLILAELDQEIEAAKNSR